MPGYELYSEDSIASSQGYQPSGIIYIINLTWQIEISILKFVKHDHTNISNDSLTVF